MTTDRHPRGASLPASDGRLRHESWAGWVRRDTQAPSDATYPVKENPMILKARSRAQAILMSSVELYREMAVSAISLVRR